ncbi:tRNA isopentenyltransferase [Obba rivulosa]|uniref:tRNA isopentenyltransferase n=1 Tax=Obba rivulosa TaxID=1052685 RepID=A0A8E2DT11_9APHY|nr:tRNA isopentenyltransferase [Obba rivulosa]
MSLRPLIAICGTTGVGKSKLAIELALALSASEGHKHGYRGARIINADAMQTYIGMDVITNKVTRQEMRGVEHLLMDCKRPGEQYVIGEWVQDAMKTIDETHERNQLPIVVGGTAYWIQHLVFPNRLPSIERPAGDDAVDAPLSPALAERVSCLPPDLLRLWAELPEGNITDPVLAMSLHKLLSLLDPIVAARWHWRDSRKVVRELEVIKENGRPASEIIAEQSRAPITARYRTLFLWIHANPDALNPRLDARVDQMVEQGLLEEIMTLQRIASENTASQDTMSSIYTTGIYQAIGYKEFHHYLSYPEPSEEAFEKAVEDMKQATRKYAKRQVAWFRNKLLPAVKTMNESSVSESGSLVAPTYVLDATDVGDKWMSSVQKPAERITHDFLEGKELPDPFSVCEAARELMAIKYKPTDPAAVLEARRLVTCDMCTVNKDEPFMVENANWGAHVKSRTHRRLVARAERLADENIARRIAERQKKKALEKSLNNGEAAPDNDISH